MSEGELVRLEDFPSKVSPQPPIDKPAAAPGEDVSLVELEREHIRRVAARGLTREETARILGIDPATLYRKRRKYGI